MKQRRSQTLPASSNTHQESAGFHNKSSVELKPQNTMLEPLYVMKRGLKMFLFHSETAAGQTKTMAGCHSLDH